MKRLIVALILCLTLSTAVWAEDIYVAQSAAGADDGTSCANAKSRAWLHAGPGTNWGDGAGKVSAGDTLHVCGTWTISHNDSGIIVGGSGSVGRPITILFEDGAIITSENYGNTDLYGGIVMTGKSYITIDGGTNGIIRATNTGSKTTYGYGLVYPSPCTCVDATPDETPTEKGNNTGVNVFTSSNIIIKNLTIEDMYISTTAISPCDGCRDPDGEGPEVALQEGEQANDAYTYGIKVGPGSSYIYIYDNTINRSAIGVKVVQTNGDTTQHVYQNTIYKCGVGIWGTANGTTGNIATDFQFYANTIHYPYGEDDSQKWCYIDGIKMFGDYNDASYYDRVLLNTKIYNNTFGPGLFNPLRAKAVGTAHILADLGAFNGMYIYNNLFLVSASECLNGAYIKMIEIGRAPLFDAAEMNASVFNNTAVGLCTTYGISLINAVYNALNVDIQNNIIRNVGSLNCVGYSGGATVDAETANIWYSGTGSYQSNCITTGGNARTDPLIGTNYVPLTGSPAINGGVNLSALGVTTDKTGTTRPQGAAWDIGAYEFISSPGYVSGGLLSGGRVSQ